MTFFKSPWLLCLYTMYPFPSPSRAPDKSWLAVQRQRERIRLARIAVSSLSVWYHPVYQTKRFSYNDRIVI